MYESAQDMIVNKLMSSKMQQIAQLKIDVLIDYVNNEKKPRPVDIKKQIYKIMTITAEERKQLFLPISESMKIEDIEIAKKFKEMGVEKKKPKSNKGADRAIKIINREYVKQVNLLVTTTISDINRTIKEYETTLALEVDNYEQ